MTPQRQLTIIEHQTLDITHHIGRALHNTHQSMQDGYPTRSPGDGNPGGGSITATSRPPRHALLTRPDPATWVSARAAQHECIICSSSPSSDRSGRPSHDPASCPTVAPQGLAAAVSGDEVTEGVALAHVQSFVCCS